MKHKIPQKAFYYIRHGEFEWNVLDQFAGGGVDTILTDLGKKQAEDKKSAFEALSPSPSHIIHSPLSRAKDTALILNQDRNLPMIAEYDLREIMAGDWEGIPNTEAKKRWDMGLSPKNGEDIDMLAQRMQDIFTKILSNPDYDVPLIAAHGRLLNGLDHLFGIAPRSLQVGNCQLMRFVPHDNMARGYPFDVFILTMKNGQLHKELADWSRI